MILNSPNTLNLQGVRMVFLFSCHPIAGKLSTLWHNPARLVCFVNKKYFSWLYGISCGILCMVESVRRTRKETQTNYWRETLFRRNRGCFLLTSHNCYWRSVLPTDVSAHAHPDVPAVWPAGLNQAFEFSIEDEEQTQERCPPSWGSHQEITSDVDGCMNLPVKQQGRWSGDSISTKDWATSEKVREVIFWPLLFLPNRRHASHLMA
jgi:hypothetical protein